ncbi:MAG: hypothetical protein WCC90_20955 [Methylocella sp.]
MRIEWLAAIDCVKSVLDVAKRPEKFRSFELPAFRHHLKHGDPHPADLYEVEFGLGGGAGVLECHSVRSNAGDPMRQRLNVFGGCRGCGYARGEAVPVGIAANPLLAGAGAGTGAPAGISKVRGDLPFGCHC